MVWRKNRGAALALGLYAAGLACLSAHAAQPAAQVRPAPSCEKTVATLAAAQGEVRHRTPGQDWQAAVLDQAFCAGVELQVSPGGRAVLRLGDGSAIPLDQNTHIVLRGLAADGVSVQMELVSGNINVATSGAAPLQLITPHGRVETQGGDFAVKVTPQQSALSVFEGDVAVSNPGGSLILQSDETVFFAQVAAPRRDITVKPRELVQWVLQYPAIIQAQDAKATPWAEAALALEQGRLLDALISLDQVPGAARNAEYYVFRANLLLLAGEVDEARGNLETALRLNPSLADAWALRAILDLGKNDTAQALQHAEKAVQLGPQSAAAHLAHSYALQANRQSAAALASARRVVELAPERAFGFTRLAELELARGEQAAALQAAQRAEQLNPKSAEAKTMLGFVYLSQDKLPNARAAFEAALRLNSADPRARMGLGLTRIRQGQLQAGREDLELAASLDPENPLIRTYLGRAYDTEGRKRDAAEQYARAKIYDAQDPTPYFFTALQLAENNQPVSAREQMQEALARNENRAVYRGQALLDEDQALRKANEVGIDLELGFEDDARAKASAAVVRAPTSGVLHRALGDSLVALPRSEPTRQGEYLQALMREPIGVLPAPLSIDEIVGNSASAAPQHSFFQAVSPGQIGYNDFGAAFNSSGFRAELDGLLGGQDTGGEQLRLAAGNGKIGVTLSQLHFKTDGFGEFERLNNTIWQGAFHAELETGTRIYAEYRHFDSRRNDILGRAEPFFFTALDVDEQRRRNRYGLRQRIGENHELLLLDSRDRVKQLVQYLPTPATILNGILLEPLFSNQLTNRSHTSEAQYVFHSGDINLQLGTLRSKTESTNDNGFSITDLTIKTRNNYAYLRYALLPNLLGEIGGSLDKATRGTLDESYASSKLGLRWEVIPGATLRAASYRVVNRFLPNAATLEPTQVAGFNQFVNDGNVVGLRTRNNGIGWDQHLDHGLSYGLERLNRIIDVPFNENIEVFYEDNWRAHLNWAVPPAFAPGFFPGWEKSLSLTYDEQTYDRPGYTGDEQIRHYAPRHLRLGANLAHGSGIGINVALTRVSAKGVFEPLINESFTDFFALPIDDRFWMLDAALSYRLPRKLGQIVVGALNLNNRQNFQYFEIDPLNPRFAPERFVYGKLVVAF